MTLPLSRKRLLVAAEDAELASLLSAAAVRLGAEVSVATGGPGAAAALAAGADVAILDLPLPELAAAEVLAACARAAVPAIAVSGVYRGERGVEELRRLGAREVFEKPFPVDAVVAAAARLAGAAAPTSAPGEAPDADAATAPLPPDDDPSISAATLPALDDPPPATAPAPRDGFATPLPETRRARPPDPDAPPPTRGTLGTTTVPRLLAALHVGQATGALALERGAVKKFLVVERGVPVYAASNVAGERLAAICVRRGIVEPERLDALRRGAPAARTAELLGAEGLLPPERHAELVAAQIRAIAWSTFEWREGSYAFQLGRPPAARVPVKLAMADVILEGVVRTATLDRLRAELPGDTHLAPAPDPAFELYALRLRPADARLLPLADGTKSVADLVRLSDQPERDTLAFLQACRVMRVLDAVDRVLASTRRIGFM